MARMAQRATVGLGGFTLVELVTVIAILGILVTLTVGAVQAVQTSIAVNATKQMFRALESALGRYYDDWGAYPFTANVTDPFNPGRNIMGLVLASDPAFSAMGSVSNADQKRQFVLRAALTLNRRKGPYFEGGDASTVNVPTAVGKSFPAYADGWGRPIGYDRPPTSGSQRKTKPLLTSRGVKESVATDDLNNYKD